MATLRALLVVVVRRRGKNVVHPRRGARSGPVPLRGVGVSASVLACLGVLVFAPLASGAEPRPGAQAQPAPTTGLQPLPPPASGALPRLPPTSDAPAISASPAAPAASSPAYAPSVQLTPEQIKTFADVVDDAESHTADRLARDPNLAPLALQAVEARSHRKTLGSVLAGIGVTVFVVGQIAGSILIVTTPGYPAHVQDTSPVVAGLVVSILATALGAGLAVPGFIQVGKSSEAENKAVRYYRGDQEAMLVPPVLARCEGIRVPLFALSF
jgi:hypothetical protein